MGNYLKNVVLFLEFQPQIKMPKSTIPGSATIIPKNNNERQDSYSPIRCISHPLSKYHCQNWHQLFEYEKVLKQIRSVEKCHTKGKSGHCTNSEFSSIRNFSSSIASQNNKSRKNLLRQVQRLCGTDMHYYGIVPKRTALEVIVCSACMGIYTKIGFNNHMMLQHPSIWTNISTKIGYTQGDISCTNNDNSQDSVKSNKETNLVTSEVLQPPELLCPTSTVSNLSPSSISATATLLVASKSNNYSTPNSRYKHNTKTGNPLTFNNCGNGTRCRSKNKLVSTSTNNSDYLTLPAESSLSLSLTKKSSCKRSSSKIANNTLSLISSNSSSENINLSSPVDSPNLKLINELNTLDNVILSNANNLSSKAMSLQNIKPGTAINVNGLNLFGSSSSYESISPSSSSSSLSSSNCCYSLPSSNTPDKLKPPIILDVQNTDKLSSILKTTDNNTSKKVINCYFAYMYHFYLLHYLCNGEKIPT